MLANSGFTRPFDWVLLNLGPVLLDLVPVLLNLGPVLLELTRIDLRIDLRWTSELTSDGPPTCLITMAGSETPFSHNQVQNA